MTLLVIQGGGFDCADNSTSGDGKWNNVASQLDWILAQMIPGGPTGSFFCWNCICHACDRPGQIELRGGPPAELGGPVAEGNVFLDGKLVCTLMLGICMYLESPSSLES